jgi:single-strand DNA-binding protein
MKLIGVARLGNDAEIRITPSGKPVANLSLAYNYGKKDSEGKRQTQWVDAALWGDQAERLKEWLIKGTVLNVTCRDVHIEVFEGRNGTGHKLVGTVVDLEFVPKQRDDGGGRQQEPRQPSTPAQNRGGFAGMDDDIPFFDTLGRTLWRVV